MRRAALWLFVASGASAQTFERDVLPILQEHCQGCHRTGGIAPMPLTTYEQARPWAKAVRQAVLRRTMPPWFAEEATIEFRNAPRLTGAQRELISRWALAGAPQGERRPATTLPRPPDRHISPDEVFRMAEPIAIPKGATLPYQFVILPGKFAQDKWVRGVDVIPGNASVVHHAVVYVRAPEMSWLRGADRSRRTTADILSVYAPGSSAVDLPEGYAKKIPAGSDLVLQLHYTAKKTDTHDQTAVGLRYASPPAKRVHTLQMAREDFLIEPGDANARFSAGGTLPADVELLSLFPHMHLRGSAFEFIADRRLLLRVKPYDFFWQLTYWLKDPLPLKKGTRLLWTGWFDNSAANPRNPDAGATVRVGEQSWEEMLVGFFDVAADPALSKEDLFRLR